MGLSDLSSGPPREPQVRELAEELAAEHDITVDEVFRAADSELRADPGLHDPRTRARVARRVHDRVRDPAGLAAHRRRRW